ncbi:MAG: hypothetical protein ACI4J1_12285 [Ruminiclostridium sp.]
MNLPQISQVSNTSAAGGGYSTTLNNGAGQFNINQLDRQNGVTSATDKKQGGITNTQVRYENDSPVIQTARDPASAMDTLRDIITKDLLNSAKLNGYTELAGELDELNNSLYISPDKLVDEMLSQEEQNTVFSGDRFYDLLRRLAAAGDEDMNQSIGVLLKAINFAQSKEQILDALASNMKFLSEYFSPNKSLSESLLNLSNAWSESSGENYGALKNQTMSLLNDLSGSLLNDDRTQTLIPLIINTLSKYNTNSYMLKEAFGEVMSQIPSSADRNELISAFEKLLGKILNQQTDNITYNNNTANGQKNQVQNELIGKETEKNTKNLSQFPLETEKIANTLASALEKSENFSTDEFMKAFLLGKTDGMETIKEMLGSLLENQADKALLEQGLGQIENMDQLVDFLNELLGKMPDNENRQLLFENLEEIISHMADKNELSQQNLSFDKNAGTLEKLTTFIGKNINHPALTTLDGYNAANLLQSMLNAPGVFTPLAHYILPLQIEDSKAFGELWVDNEGKKSTGGKIENNYHLFLTFEVEATGRFELNLYAKDSNVNITLLHPWSYIEKVPDLTAKINRFVTSVGFSPKGVTTGILKKPHALSEVFPKLTERRSGLNVKA